LHFTPHTGFGYVPCDTHLVWLELSNLCSSPKGIFLAGKYGISSALDEASYKVSIAVSLLRGLLALADLWWSMMSSWLAVCFVLA